VVNKTANYLIQCFITSFAVIIIITNMYYVAIP